MRVGVNGRAFRLPIQEQVVSDVLLSGHVVVAFPQKTIASVAPSITSPQKPGGTVGGSWSFGSVAGVVTANGSLKSDQLHAEPAPLP